MVRHGLVAPAAFTTAFTAVLVGVLAARSGAQHAIVASRGTTTPATLLLDVDPVTGTFLPLPPFPSDNLPPRAILVDPVNRDLVLALDNGATSRLVRLQYRGGAFVGERRLGDVTGAITQLAVGLGDDVIAATDGPAGALLRLPRTGGSATVIAPLPRATALTTWGGVYAGHALLAQSGTMGIDPQLRLLDLTNGQTTNGPYVFTGFTPQGITGIVDLPTALFRQVLSHDDGTVSMSVNFATPVGIPLTPVLPAGATRAMKPMGFTAFVLGGQAHPYLKSFTTFPPSSSWTIVSLPLPGDPVDFDFDLLPAPDVVHFGAGCSPLSLNLGPGGPPRLGNSGFSLELTAGRPQQPAVLLLGTSDQNLGPFSLPILLPPGTCSLRVTPDLILQRPTDPLGAASFALPVPNDPGLHGGILFAQFLQLPAGSFVTSQGAALHLAR